MIDLNFSKNGYYELIIFQKTGENEKKQTSYTLLLKYIINVNIIETKKKTVKLISKNNINNKANSHSPSKKLKRKNESTTSLLNTSQTSVDIFFSTKNDTLISALKPKCYDNVNAFVFEPKNNNIKIGVAQKFKVKVKGAINVAVLDYKQFHYLKKRGEDLWEGTITLKTGFVSILSQKSSSLFTEIYEFTNFK